MDHHRGHDVQVELTRLGGKGNCGIVPHDMEADHVQAFGHDGIDLPRHDGGAGLDRGEGDLRKARGGAGAQQSEIVGYPAEFPSKFPDSPGVRGHDGPALQGLERVRRGLPFAAGQ